MTRSPLGNGQVAFNADVLNAVQDGTLPASPAQWGMFFNESLTAILCLQVSEEAMTHQMVDSTVRTARATMAVRDASGPSYIAQTQSRHSDLDDDDGLEDDVFEDNDDDDLDEDGLAPDIEGEEDDDGETEQAGDGSAAANSRVLGGIDDLGF